MDNFISASWFVTYGYCEYKFYLQYVLKVKAPITPAMQVGAQIHAKKEEQFLKTAVPIIWDDFLKSSEYAFTKEVQLRNKFENNVILGKVDEVGVDRDGIYIIEDKPHPRLFDGTKMQIFAYCFMFKRTFSEKTAKPIYAILRDRDTNEEVWKEQFGIKNESSFTTTITRIKKILQNEENPIPTQNPNKCAACIMNKINACKFSLAAIK